MYVYNELRLRELHVRLSDAMNSAWTKVVRIKEGELDDKENEVATATKD